MSNNLRQATWALLLGLWRRATTIDTVSNPLNRPLDQAIATIGFRKWYERELLSGHAHMVLCLLATLGLMASLEAMRGASAGERLLDVLLAAVCAWVGIWSLRRYLALLSRAESIANQATCNACAAYGLLKLDEADAPPSEPYARLRVRCRKCASTWDIEV
jgi:hypothetical protein